MSYKFDDIDDRVMAIFDIFFDAIKRDDFEAADKFLADQDKVSRDLFDIEIIAALMVSKHIKAKLKNRERFYYLALRRFVIDKGIDEAFETIERFL